MEIDKFQSDCKHVKQEIKALENNDIRYVCRGCYKVLGWPGPTELEKWLRK